MGGKGPGGPVTNHGGEDPMKRIAWTFIGKDRPGIVAEVSRVLSESGCNIEDTTMTILEGQFAMILIVQVPSRSVETRLKTVFERSKTKWGLNHFWNVLRGKLVRGEKHPSGSKTYVVSVIGKDRTGIVHETSRVLARSRLNITDLNSKILGRGKKAVFAMVLEVDAPRGFDMKRLAPTWRKLEKRLKVDIRVKPLERVSF